MRVMADRPRLMEHLGYVWLGYQRLSSCRPLGPTGVGQIPWTAIDQYCDRIGVSGPEYDYYVGLIQSLDTTYLDLQPKGGTTGPNRRGPKS